MMVGGLRVDIFSDTSHALHHAGLNLMSCFQNQCRPASVQVKYKVEDAGSFRCLSFGSGVTGRGLE